MVNLVLDDLTEYELNRLWIPETLFHYATSGSVERQEGATETFFYGDKRPEAHALVFRLKRSFETATSAVQWIRGVEAVLPSVEMLNYDLFDIDISKAYMSWNFGSKMNEIEATLTLVPIDNYNWVVNKITMSRADILVDRIDIFMNTLRGT